MWNKVFQAKTAQGNLLLMRTPELDVRYQTSDVRRLIKPSYERSPVVIDSTSGY